ncbi:MAG TPA: hypothetical protein DEB39_06795, partial [Planctomycetaceae bacterium]|nr:hypothetical protein [Planctomycetaceae bacterium]
MLKTVEIIGRLREAGATDCILVGGYVRDVLLERKRRHLAAREPMPRIDGLKDVDIEVYGLDYAAILRALKPRFRVNLVGKSFGVVKVDNRYDVSIPRREYKTGSGHKGFDVEPDPFMSPQEAMGRRDFTVNAIGMRPDGTLVDPYQGIRDLEQGVLRATTPAFAEDPLRVLRGMQFAARFGFTMEAGTVELCRRLLPESESLSPERVWGEWFKWATKSRYPSKGLLVLKETGWIDAFPEIAALVGTPQNPRYHPEGDVFTHTCLAVDAAVQTAKEMRFAEQDRIVLLFAALTHDFGKPCTTVRREDGTWTSPNHAAQGVPFVESFFDRMRAPHWVGEHVKPLVAEHMAHLALPSEERPSDRIVRRLATRLEPSSIRMWAALCRSDAKGCRATFERHRTQSWQEVAERLAVLDEKPRPILQGRDLLPLGFRPGPGMGR